MMRKVLISLFLFGLLIAYPTSAIAYNIPDLHGSSMVAASPGSDNVPADGITNAVMTVQLKDADGNLLADETVKIVITNDSEAVVSPATSVLDSNGRATFYIKSTHIGSDSIDIVDLTQNVTLAGIGHVTFYNPNCHDMPPASAPKLTSTVALSNTQIKLTWTKAAGPVTFYSLYYGVSKGVYIYGNPNIGNADATTYTVGSLNPGTTYYFIVIPGNGCTLGPASNEMSAKAVLLTPTPSPIPTSIPIITPRATLLPNPTSTPSPASESQKTAAVNSKGLNPAIKFAIVISIAGLILATGGILISRRKH